MIRPLAERAKFNAQTIWRLENGKQKTTHPSTVAKLAPVLEVQPAVLTGEAPMPEITPTPEKDFSKIPISKSTENALYLIHERYRVPCQQVLELAPVLFCWAAEMSLRERSERLKKLEEMCEVARALAQGLEPWAR